MSEPSPSGDPDGFANHTPMAAEAMVALGVADAAVLEWYALHPGAPSDHETSAPTASWQASLGDLSQLSSLVALVDVDVEELGWQSALRRWCGRLLYGLDAHLFHGMIRTAHAARALQTADTLARRRELALAIATWAARVSASHADEADASPSSDACDPQADILAHALRGARAYAQSEGLAFVELHCITSAMAYLDMLAPVLLPEHHRIAKVVFDRSHGALAKGFAPSSQAALPPIDFPDLGTLRLHPSKATMQGHVFKLYDAALRGHRRTGNHAFAHCAAKILGIQHLPSTAKL